MKYFFVVLFPFILSLPLLAQLQKSKDLPKDLLTSTCILTVEFEDEEYSKEIEETVRKDFEQLGILLQVITNVSKNPTLKQRKNQALLDTILASNIVNKIHIDFVSIYTGMTLLGDAVESTKVVVNVMRVINQEDSTPVAYTIFANSYPRALIKLKKDIIKQLNPSQ